MSERIWTEAEEALIRKHYPKEGSANLALILGKSQQQVISKARHLGIKCEVLTGWRSPENKAKAFDYLFPGKRKRRGSKT